MIEDDSAQIFRKNLTTYLKISRKGQNFFAHQMGVHVSTLSRWLKGERRLPIEAMDKAAFVTGIPSYEWINPQLKFEVKIKHKITPDLK
jgi:transcriptional regulator with XRE-family HTH domain|tara:strand:- start:231 stop:497 length:267 start_codon:yes stop_codon:yes gene_type:complete